MKKDDVIKAIGICRKTCNRDGCNGCPYQDDYGGFARRNYGELSCVSELLADALELIVEGGLNNE